jgi:hypothetical protein
MHTLIEKLLRKRGIKDFSELDNEPMIDKSPTEKETFEGWQAVLSKEELTIKDIKEFCESQIGIIEGKWKDLSIQNEKKAELIPYHTVYKNLLAAIDSPQAARENLEKHLIELTK